MHAMIKSFLLLWIRVAKQDHLWSLMQFKYKPEMKIYIVLIHTHMLSIWQLTFLTIQPIYGNVTNMLSIDQNKNFYHKYPHSTHCMVEPFHFYFFFFDQILGNGKLYLCLYATQITTDNFDVRLVRLSFYHFNFLKLLFQ